MILNTRNIITINQSKESTSILGSKHIHDSVYHKPLNHAYTKISNRSNIHSHSNRSNSNTNPNNTNSNANIMPKDTNDYYEDYTIKLPKLLSKVNKNQRCSLPRAKLKHTMKERLIVLIGNYKVTKPSEFYSKLQNELLSLQNAKNRNSHRYRNHPEPLSPISTTHNINTFSERNYKSLSPNSHRYEHRFESDSIMNKLLPSNGNEKAKSSNVQVKDPKQSKSTIRAKNYSSMNDIQSPKPDKDSTMKFIIKKRKGVNWNFFSKDALRNNANNSNLIHISKYESPMNVIQNDSLVKKILMNNLSYMGSIKL